jgi:hypothetical protein
LNWYLASGNCVGLSGNTAFVWIRDVDVPSELVAASRAGELVLFVGAGASRDRPAGLPDFRALIEEIGRAVDSPPTQEDVRHPDVYLGRLADRGVAVHQLVANAINRAGSQPNALHRAIVRLASVNPSPRIVTTNYDLHLTTAALDDGQPLPVYQAPALPVGDDFQGIVHLHGSLDQEPRRLVVTDEDFGRAYLLEAWAARFLERMFTAFTVLFIGYSHGDVVMQYLARSLGPSGKRFVCTSDGDDPAWRQYGLTPVPYDVVEGNHAALPGFIARWAELSAMGQTQHRALIGELVAAGPPTIPEDVSYLDEVLKDSERIKYFVERARGDEWFEWVAQRPAFNSLFSVDHAETDAARLLISWIAGHYMLDERSSALALRAMRDRSWPPEICGTVVHRLLSYDDELAPWLSPWLLLALQNGPGGRNDLLDLLLAEGKWGTNIGLALTLLEDRTRPLLRSTISFTASDIARFEIDLAGDEHWLSQAWSKVFAPALQEHLAPILATVDEQIVRVYRAWRCLGTEFDPFSFRRSAIEPHEQDEFRESVDMLIDAARECIEYALVEDAELADGCIDSWSNRREALFHRLAVHAWRVRSDRTPDEKLNWLRSRGWLWEIDPQHEVYRLLQDAFPTAGDEIVQAFVDLARLGPPATGDEEISAYSSYNLLAWLARSAPERPYVARAFEECQATHPDFGPRDHPDLNHYMTSGFVEDTPPYSADELHSRITEDARAAVGALRNFDDDSSRFTGPTWTGALRSLQACVSTYPGDGLVVADVLMFGDGDMRNAIVNGWDTAELDDQMVADVLDTIDGWDPDEIRHAGAKMFSNGGSQTHPTAWHRYPRGREVARGLWPSNPVRGGIGEGDDLVMEAINHPAGDLAQFWTKVVQWEWTQAGDEWNGLNEELSSELDRMLSSADRNGLLARTFLASQLHFYFAADQAWASSRLLPLFNWDSGEDQARGAWQGFLTWGRPNDGLLAAGLLDGYVETCRHLDALGSRRSHELSTHLALIAVHTGVDPLEWLTRFVVAAPEDLRVSWVNQVAHYLEELPPSEAGRQWTRWISAYWSGRVQSTPLPLTTAEASAMARWLIGLPTVRGDAVSLLVQTPAGLAAHGGFLHRIHDLDLAPDAAIWAMAITHLLRGTSGPAWAVGHYLKDIVRQLREADPTLDLSPILEEALRLGITEAGEW